MKRECAKPTRESTNQRARKKNVRAKKSVLLFLDVDHLRREIFS